MLLALAAPPAWAEPAAAPTGTPVACHGALSVKDGQIVGQHGEPVTLRGMRKVSTVTPRP